MKRWTARGGFVLYFVPILLSLAACMSTGSGGGGCGMPQTTCGQGTVQQGNQCVPAAQAPAQQTTTQTQTATQATPR